MNPDATINLVPDFPETGSPAWIAARMAAGDAPDITFDHWFRRNLEGGNWWVSLNEFLEMPNPYIARGRPGPRTLAGFPLRRGDEYFSRA